LRDNSNNSRQLLIKDRDKEREREREREAKREKKRKGPRVEELKEGKRVYLFTKR
jgi:hypothetical protein